MANWQPTRQIQQKNPFTEAGALFNKALSGAASIGDTMAKKDYDKAQSALDAELALATDPNDVEAVKKKILAQSTNNGKFLDPGKALQQANDRTKSLQKQSVDDLKDQLTKLDYLEKIGDHKAAEALRDRMRERDVLQVEGDITALPERTKTEVAELREKQAVIDKNIQQRKWDADLPEAMSRYSIIDSEGNPRTDWDALFKDPAFKGMPFAQQNTYIGDEVLRLKLANNVLTEGQRAKLFKEKKEIDSIVKDNYDPNDPSTSITKIMGLVKGKDLELVKGTVTGLKTLATTPTEINRIEQDYQNLVKSSNQTKYFNSAIKKATIDKVDKDGKVIGKEINFKKFMENANKDLEDPLAKFLKHISTSTTIKNYPAAVEAAENQIFTTGIDTRFKDIKDVIDIRFNSGEKEDVNPEAYADAVEVLATFKEALKEPANRAKSREFIKNGGIRILQTKIMQAATDGWIEKYDDEMTDNEVKILNSWDPNWEDLIDKINNKQSPKPDKTTHSFIKNDEQESATFWKAYGKSIDPQERNRMNNSKRIQDLKTGKALPPSQRG